MRKVSLVTVERCEWTLTLYFNQWLISASLNKNNKGVGENNDVEPTILSNFISALRIYVLHIDLHNVNLNVEYNGDFPNF